MSNSIYYSKWYESVFINSFYINVFNFLYKSNIKDVFMGCFMINPEHPMNQIQTGMEL